MSINTNALVLYRKDLNKTKDPIQFNEIQHYHFSIKFELDFLRKQDIILFVDDDGKTKILKNRYGVPDDTQTNDFTLLKLYKILINDTNNNEFYIVDENDDYINEYISQNTPFKPSTIINVANNFIIKDIQYYDVADKHLIIDDSLNFDDEYQLFELKTLNYKSFYIITNNFFTTTKIIKKYTKDENLFNERDIIFIKHICNKYNPNSNYYLNRLKIL